jgi:hypothetical protein
MLCQLYGFLLADEFIDQEAGGSPYRRRDACA